MPDTIQFKNGNQIINRYTANGVKQRADYYTALTQELLPIGGVCQWVNRPSDVVHTFAAARLYRVASNQENGRR